jgi:hypothetical protein
VLDPEALVIGTVQFGRYDPRLFDAALDWWAANGRRLSSTRLQRLRRVLMVEEERILTAAAGVIAEGDNAGKWAGTMSAERTEGPIPLFLQQDGRPLPQGARSDPAFLKHGVVRPPWTPRETGLSLAAGEPAVLVMRLRALFGVASRAEILAFLMTHPKAHPSLVARQTYYAQPPVAKALADMALSGLVTERRRGREVEYSLDRAGWLRFLGLRKDPAWANWGLLVGALRAIWGGTQTMQGRMVTPGVLGSELGQCAREINSMLYESEVGVLLSDPTPGRPEAYPEVFVEGVGTLFEHLGVGFRMLTGVG